MPTYGAYQAHAVAAPRGVEVDEPGGAVPRLVPKVGLCAMTRSNGTSDQSIGFAMCQIATIMVKLPCTATQRTRQDLDLRRRAGGALGSLRRWLVDATCALAVLAAVLLVPEFDAKGVGRRRQRRQEQQQEPQGGEEADSGLGRHGSLLIEQVGLLLEARTAVALAEPTEGRSIDAARWMDAFCP